MTVRIQSGGDDLQTSAPLLRHSCKSLQALVGHGVRYLGLDVSNWPSVWRSHSFAGAAALSASGPLVVERLQTKPT